MDELNPEVVAMQTETPVVVPPVETAKVEPPVDSARFAALAKREREIVRHQQELKAKEAEITSKQKAYEDYQASLKSAKDNPIKALEAMGLSPEDISEYLLNDNKPTPGLEVKKIRDELNEFKKQQQDMIQKEKEYVAAEQKRTLDNFYKENKEFVKKNADKYELLNLEEDNLDLVNNRIEEFYKETLAEGNPRILSAQEAADMVEGELEARLLKYIATKKIKQKVSPQKAEDSDLKVETKQFNDEAKTQTLSNKLSAATQNPYQKSYITEEERIKRALAILESN